MRPSTLTCRVLEKGGKKIAFRIEQFISFIHSFVCPFVLSYNIQIFFKKKPLPHHDEVGPNTTLSVCTK